MAKATDIRKVRDAKISKEAKINGGDRFVPCSQDMTICGDCEGNRAKNKCPRLKERVERKKAD